MLRNWRLHKDFRENIRQWLLDWKPNCDSLILLGPSAGWFLPRAFTERFSLIFSYDIDLCAKPLFHLVHRRTEGIIWHSADFTVCLESILRKHPRSAVLFCNVLGQLGVTHTHYEEILRDIPNILSRYHWASFHDRYSTEDGRNTFNHVQPFSTRQAMTIDVLQELGFCGNWTDHGTGSLLTDNTIRRYFPWRFGQNQLCWVEGFTSSPSELD